MGWAEIRAKARDVVHGTFCISALYTSKDQTYVDEGVNVRLHNDLQKYGDLDREGYVERLENLNQVLYDSYGIEFKRNDTISFVFNGTRFNYNIDNITPPGDGNRYFPAQITIIK